MNLNFNPELCRNETEVESKLIVSYLLPQLGYSPDIWHQEVKLASNRLDFLALLKPLIPFVLDKKAPLSVIIEAKHPKENLDRHQRKLKTYLLECQVRCGVLTNGKQFRIYELSKDEMILRFQCAGSEIETNLDAIKKIIGREVLKRESLETAAASSPAPLSLLPSPSPPLMAMIEEMPMPAPKNNFIKEEPSTMQVIAIYHNKGGVGKTTVSVNLAAALKNKGHRVLLIDLDSQANSTFATGLIKFQFEEEDNLINNYVYHLLEAGDFHFIPEVARPSETFNQPEIDVIPSHIDLIVHQEKLNRIGASRSRLLTKLNRVKELYDIVIIDTPPSRDLYAEIALITANHLIIPSDLKPFANQGLANVKMFVKLANEFRENMMGRVPLNIMGVLPSKISTNTQFMKHTFPRQKSAVTGYYQLPLMETVIYERMPLSHSISYMKKTGETELEVPDPKSIFEFCKIDRSTSAAQSAQEFEDLANEVLRKI